METQYSYPVDVNIYKINKITLRKFMYCGIVNFNAQDTSPSRTSWTIHIMPNAPVNRDLLEEIHPKTVLMST